ncbi:MAG: tyrosine-type recombinase/integrase [Bacteroidetes bacterium]|nr:tyrosine-type recombinase/integrase [Bacteroidota bacterium]
MSGLNKVNRSTSKQAKPLTEDKILLLLETATLMEAALLQVQRDGLLRISEVAAVQWTDLSVMADGTGCLLIRRSKTDQEGKGHVVFLRKQTVDALVAYGVQECGRIFPKSTCTLRRRIKRLTASVLGEEGYSGHSCRVGMVNDLVERGASLLAVQTVGRWRSQSMPAHYARNILAGQNAVAQFMG